MLTSLERSREAVAPALRAALERLDATSRHQAAYHFGWYTVDGRPAAGSGGKAVRPALALLSARAAGASEEVGLPGAVAVEMVHNFSLLHDDLMDGDETRHHRRTVWAVWGSAGAILTGDALLALSSEILLDCGSPYAGRAASLLAVATRDLIRGQVQDLAFETRDDVTLDECLDMVSGKTGALLSASAAIGAVLAGAPQPLLGALSTFGAHLGIVFQIVDDMLGIWGDPEVTGKPVYSDLRSHKKSLPVTYAATSGTPAGRKLARWLADRRPVTEADLPRVAGLVEQAGGRDWATTEVNRRMSLANAALDQVAIPSPVHAELDALADFLTRRQS